MRVFLELENKEKVNSPVSPGSSSVPPLVKRPPSVLGVPPAPRAFAKSPSMDTPFCSAGPVSLMLPFAFPPVLSFDPLPPLPVGSEELAGSSRPDSRAMTILSILYGGVILCLVLTESLCGSVPA